MLTNDQLVTALGALAFVAGAGSVVVTLTWLEVAKRCQDILRMYGRRDYNRSPSVGTARSGWIDTH
jgi:hypothetical protein